MIDHSSNSLPAQELESRLAQKRKPLYLKMGRERGPLAQCLSEIGKSPSSWLYMQSNAGGERK
jgi:hypothetical protein